MNKCVVCKKEFVPQHNATGRYCSMSCFNVHRTHRIVIECVICKKQITIGINAKTKYCSRSCYYEMKRRRGDRVVWTEEMRKTVSQKMSGKNNWNYGNPKNIRGYKRPEHSRENHPRWKGGYYITEDGYKMLNGNRSIDELDIPEHRKIMEDYLGRKLNTNEVVHHKNEIRDDNRIENLQVMTRAEHINHHREELLIARRIKRSAWVASRSM